VRFSRRALAVGCAAALAASVAYCNVYNPSLLTGGDSGLPPGGGIGWWSGNDGSTGCYSAGAPTPADRPAAGDTSSIPPIYLAIRSMRLGSQDVNFQPDPNAWEDLGFDLDGVCTNSPTCSTDNPIVSCKPTGVAIPFDGNYCRDNTFGRLEVQASNIKEVGGKYGLNDDAFNCALCVGDYNFIIRISNYNGQADDDQVRVDLYPSPGLEKPLPWDCTQPGWRNDPCFTPDLPFTIRDTAVTQPQGGPDLPDAVLNDPNAYVKRGYLVAALPPNALFWFPGHNALATAFPLSLAQAVVTAHIVKAQDGTWSVDDGTIGGRSTEQDMIHSFRLIGFCENDPNYSLLLNFLHANLDILANGAVDPNTTCDSMSVGIAFTATQAVAGKLVHIADLTECPFGAGDGGVEGGADGGSTDAGGQ